MPRKTYFSSGSIRLHVARATAQDITCCRTQLRTYLCLIEHLSRESYIRRVCLWASHSTLYFAPSDFRTERDQERQSPGLHSAQQKRASGQPGHFWQAMSTMKRLLSPNTHDLHSQAGWTAPLCPFSWDNHADRHAIYVYGTRQKLKRLPRALAGRQG